MTRYVVETLGVSEAEADHLRATYWRQYGTTLAGLMREHQIDPDPYLVAVHDVDMSHLTPAPDLAGHIAALPGRKIVYTNGSAPYAQRVLAARGLDGLFDDVFGVEHANYQPKPERAAFDMVFNRAGVVPEQAAMFEDDPRNLAAPHALGMRTVHVAERAKPAPHIHHHTDDLTGFLAQLTTDNP
ncbi:putative hydrolase of the HAD superfamily [Epibacterium ulvae]|uniref:Putative hydrolase of the HAD superfamily n=2 Tax=Epibacterium ulvae TaxID=1156985 RepID=A0A1G5R3X9_9RHOB|nr:putative hydrolase of the HAD superfamily [Epibacterium ulvae]